MENVISDFAFGVWLWQTFLLLILGLWLFCLVDDLRHQFENKNKNTWLLVVMFLPMVGSLFYLFIGRKERIKTVIE